MGKITIEQYIFCNSFESAKNISRAFQNFKFKFYNLGSRSSVYAKRFIRKSSSSKYYPYTVIIKYPIEYNGEFLEYGFLDKRTKDKYPELIEKLLNKDCYEKIRIISEYACLEDELCRDIYYYNDFEEFFNRKLKPLMNKIYIASAIAFANIYKTDSFAIYYKKNNTNYERGYFAHESYEEILPNKYFPTVDITPINISSIWHWMNKLHKYKKDRFVSEARPLTALTYALNRSNFERTFYSVVGLESVYTQSEKMVRKQLKNTIPKLFPDVSETDIDLFYNKRSDFAHGDIIFPDYYENSEDPVHWSDLTDASQKSTSLLIMTLRKLVVNDAVKILIDKDDNIIFKKHQAISY